MKKPWIIVMAIAALVGLGAATFGTIRASASAPDVTVYFTSEDFSLSQEQKEQIDSQLDQLAQAKRIIVHGFVQDSPPEYENRGPENLSAKRADAVAKYIQQALNQRPGKKQNATYVVEGLGQPPFDFTFREARRVEVFLQQ